MCSLQQWFQPDQIASDTLLAPGQMRPPKSGCSPSAGENQRFATSHRNFGAGRDGAATLRVPARTRAKSGANGQGKCRGLPPTAFPSSSQFSRSLFLVYVAQVFRPEAYDFG